jgi:YVTN family beta-propeller protein
VANWFSNTVSVMDAENLRTEATLPTGNGSRAFGVFLPGVPDQTPP